jgi:hypothetical protein
MRLFTLMACRKRSHPLGRQQCAHVSLPLVLSPKQGEVLARFWSGEYSSPGEYSAGLIAPTLTPTLAPRSTIGSSMKSIR